MSLAEAARVTGLNSATALRLLRTLEQWELVSRNEEGVFGSGPRLLQISASLLGNTALYQLAEKHLDQLSAETGESCYLAIPGPRGSALYVRQSESRQAVRHVSWVGESVPLDGTAIGAALTGQTVDGVAVLRASIESDVTAIAAPVTPVGRFVRAAISVVGPSFRMSDEDVRRFAELVKHHARALSAELAGGRS
jgi:DNA-binding IclR family transcriptional regulator